MSEDRVITVRPLRIRRNLEQIVHSAQEALSAWNHDEDPRWVMDDLWSVQELTKVCREKIAPAATNMDRRG